jgi:hypothetical protein
VERLRVEADARMDAFATAGGDPGAAGREALAAAARLWAEHGELLRALAEAAGRDPGAARAWERFTEPTRLGVETRVRRDIEEGRIEGIDPEPTVRALIAMNRACFSQELVGRREADLDRLVDALHEIWLRALYCPARSEDTPSRSPRRSA